MHPYIVDWVINDQHFRIPSYGFMLAVAFMVGYFEAIRRALKLEENPKHIENLFLIVVFSSVVGSRLFHVLFEELDYYLEHPLKIFALWEGGYTFYGAMILGTIGVFIYTLKKKINPLQFADIAACATTLGLFFGRIGCFLAGCCWGKPTHLPWGIIFDNPDSFTLTKNIALHPTQLYESIGGLILFIYLTWRFNRRKYVGQIFFHALLGYSVLRFMIEFYRGDEYRGYVLAGTLSYSQLISLVFIPFTLLAMFVFSRQKKS